MKSEIKVFAFELKKFVPVLCPLTYFHPNFRQAFICNVRVHASLCVLEARISTRWQLKPVSTKYEQVLMNTPNKFSQYIRYVSCCQLLYVYIINQKKIIQRKCILISHALYQVNIKITKKGCVR